MKFKIIFQRLSDCLNLSLRKTLLLPHYLNWRWWEKDKKINFATNITIGVIVGLTLSFMTHFQFMESFLNSMVDAVISKETRAIIKASQSCQKKQSSEEECAWVSRKLSPHIIFIDIDSDTFVKWGEPLLMPRDKIAYFLKLADANGAKVVYIDLLFDYPAYRPEEDAELRRTLMEIGKKKSGLKVIFPVIKSRLNNKIRKNIFDDIIESNPDFFRSFPYSSFSKSDKVVRYMRYYDIATSNNGGHVILWGVPILSAALFTNDVPKLKALEPRIIDDFKRQKQGKYHIQLSNGCRLEIANNEVFSNRIRFALLPHGTLGGEGNLFTERILPDEIEPLQQELKDKIVIIGSSSPDKESWYPTPVGEMAGIYIIGNAINVLLGDWQVRDAPLWVSFAVNMAVILFASYMFVYFSPLIARIISGALAFLILIPVTYYFYIKHGIIINTVLLFINLITPVMAMGWHGVLKTVKERMPEKRQAAS